VLEEHGVLRVSVAGHPGGHPAADDSVMWPALTDKAAALEQRGLAGSVVTQFGFDPGLVLAWLAGMRARGISVPVRVGVPGPASVRTLLVCAAKCDVSVSEHAAREYGFALDDRSGTAAPGRFIRALADGYDGRLHGEVKLHFSTFGGVAATAEWISQFRRALPRAFGAGDGRPPGPPAGQG